MIGRLLPRQIDNAYRGHRIALWLFGVVIVAKLAIALGSIFNGYEAARSADGIPLDTCSPAGVQAVVTLFALLGLLHLTICLICIVVLVRYRTMIPLMFALLLLEYLCRKLILQMMPIATSGGSPGAIINLVIVAAMVVGLWLSLCQSDPAG